MVVSRHTVELQGEDVMRRWSGPIWMAGGVVLGAALVVGASTCAPPTAVLERIPEPLLARALMGGSGSDIVLTMRGPDHITLYARPVPVGENICRVVRYGFSRREAGGFPRTPSDVSELYAILNAPDLSRTPIASMSMAAPAGAELVSPRATKACADFRDFDHLVAGDYRTLLQVSLLLETARRDIVRNRAAFPVECRDNGHSEATVSCDGLAYLRDVELKQISGVWSEAGSDRDRGLKEVYGAEITYRVNGHPVVTDLRISTERAGDASDPRITAVTMERDVF